MLRLYIIFVCASVLLGGVGPARAGSPAFSGSFATADNTETAVANPAGMVRLEETTRALELIVGHGFGDFDVDQGKTTVDGGNPDSDNIPVGVPVFGVGTRSRAVIRPSPWPSANAILVPPTSMPRRSAIALSAPFEAFSGVLAPAP
jgi:hypothetical protein